MNIKRKFTAVAAVGIGLMACTLWLTGCNGGGGGSSAATPPPPPPPSSSGGTVTGVATPSKVSLVNTN